MEHGFPVFFSFGRHPRATSEGDRIPERVGRTLSPTFSLAPSTLPDACRSPFLRYPSARCRDLGWRGRATTKAHRHSGYERWGYEDNPATARGSIVIERELRRAV
jgi:hypothetical protein